MRTLNRNKRTIYAAYYQDNIEAVDENGFYTGERSGIYSDPVPLRANVSPATGGVIQEIFGPNLSYDKVIVLEDIEGIDENTRLWVDKTPDDGKHDYVVKRVSKSINSVSIAISKVEVT